MESMRIYEISKKIGVGNKKILTELRRMGIEGKTHFSNIDLELAEKLKKLFKKEIEVEAPEEKREKEAEEKVSEVRRKVFQPQKPKIEITPAFQKGIKPVVPSRKEDEDYIALPDGYKKEIIDQEVEKLKRKGMQRAFQSIRKIEPKKWGELKRIKRTGKGKVAYIKLQQVVSQSQPISTAAPRKKAIKVTEGINIKEFSSLIGQKFTEVIKKFMELGLMVTINQPVDIDAAILVADGFGMKVEPGIIEEEIFDIEEEKESLEDLIPRAPVVTVMGHVDHGKTSLLDAIRKTRVTETEAGGITQHIGAYKVNLKGKDIVFLDTPGHEAFTAMRARGAQATDIVVLVVAADDGVMPQTVEAINHARAANVPIIVAVNKIDKPDANSQKVRTGLAEHDVIPEDWGGKNIFVEVSAKQQIGIDDLLEMVILQAEIMDLKANPKRHAKGVIIESRLDRGKGAVATVLVQKGTICVGDAFVSGTVYGKVRAIIDDCGRRISTAIPSSPVEVIGFSEIPHAGDFFVTVEDERKARQVVLTRQNKERLTEVAKVKKITLDDIFSQIQEGEIKELNIIIKADVQGSVEAVKDAFGKITHHEVKIKIIHTAVGGINESDVMLASASNAIVIGFNVRPEAKALHAAEKEGVDIRLYTVIYEAIDDVKKALEGLLKPMIKEQIIGKAEVRETFSISRVGTIAGCYVLEGTIKRSSDGIRVIRDSVVIYEGRIGSLKRFKEDIKEANAGYECGILVEKFNDIKIGDILECFVLEEIAAKL